jgi:glutathione S-transferase
MRMIDGCAKSILNLEASKKINMKTEKLLSHLEGNLKERGYMYSTDEFTMCDIYAMPLIDHILALCNSRNLKIDMKIAYPKLHEWTQVLNGNVLLQLPKEESNK